MARSSSQILQEMLPLIDSTYAVRSKYRFAYQKLGEANTKKWLESVSGAANSEPESVVRSTIAKEWPSATIDPLTCLDIFETIMWPKIAAYSPGYTDHPDDAHSPAGSSMKGVVYKTVYAANDEITCADPYGFSWDFQQMFGNKVDEHYPNIGFLDQKSQLATDLTNLKKLSKELGDSFNDNLKGKGKVNERREFLQSIFTNDNAVKLWFIETVLLNPNFAWPSSMMSIDPYFGYLLAFTGWKGGSDAFEKIVKGKLTVNGKEGIYTLGDVVSKASGDRWTRSSTNTLWYDVVQGSDGGANSHRALLPNYATRFLECYAAYLQDIKTSKSEYYNDWYAKLISDRFSLINMLVLINELVNIPGPTNRFTYNDKASQYLAALAEKYKTFEITIGD